MEIGDLKDVRTSHETALPEKLASLLPEGYAELQVETP